MRSPTPLDRKAIAPGQYYLKRGSSDWLRLILRRHGDRITYADFCGIGECWIDTFARWTGRGPLTIDELESQRVEIKKIAAICEHAKSSSLGV